MSQVDPERQTRTVNKNLIRVKTAAIPPDNPGIGVLNDDPKKTDASDRPEHAKEREAI